MVQLNIFQSVLLFIFICIMFLTYVYAKPNYADADVNDAQVNGRISYLL